MGEDIKCGCCEEEKLSENQSEQFAQIEVVGKKD